MWALEIIKLLHVKIKENEQENYGVFLNTFFDHFNYYIEKELEKNPVILLGVIQKLYSNFAARENNSIELKEFARFIFGLMMIYNKVNNDEFILPNSAFLVFFKNPSIRQSLDLNTEIQGCIRELKSGTRSFLPPIDGERQCSVNIYALIIIFNQIEANVWRALKHELEVDLEALLELFRATEKPEILMSFLQNMKHLAKKSDIFDAFAEGILRLYKTCLFNGRMPERVPPELSLSELLAMVHRVRHASTQKHAFNAPQTTLNEVVQDRSEPRPRKRARQESIDCLPSSVEGLFPSTRASAEHASRVTLRDQLRHRLMGRVAQKNSEVPQQSSTSDSSTLSII